MPATAVNTLQKTYIQTFQASFTRNRYLLIAGREKELEEKTMYDVTFPLCERTGHEKSVRRLTQPDDRISYYESLTAEDVQACFLKYESQLSTGIPSEIQKRLIITRELGTYGYFQWEFFTISLFWSLTTIEMALRLKFHQIKPPPYTLSRGKETQSENKPLWRLEPLLHKRWRIRGMQNFNGSFRSLMAWAFESRLIPHNIPIYLQEIQISFDHKFLLEIFPKKARQAGSSLPLNPINPTLEDIKNLWCSLPDATKNQLYPSNAEILAEELPNLRNQLAHPGAFNFIFIPRTAIDGYRQAIEVVNSFWT